MAQRTAEQKAKMAMAQQLRRANERNRAKAKESTLLRDDPTSLYAAIKDRDDRIRALEEEVRALKRQLAAKAVQTPVKTSPVGTNDLSHLPKVDQRFFERKLRGKT